VKTLAALFVTAVPAAAFAHPGHGATTTEPESWTHYLTEPVHLVGIVALAAISIGVAGVVWRRQRQR
jgi:hydrogenase/urease accessory protein HupE